MLEFSGKTVLVTGAAGAIGRETALLFARQGARVVAADLSFPAGVESGLTGAGNPEEVRLDVTDRAAVELLLERLVRRHGRIDVVVNAAGVLNTRAFLDIAEEDWDRVFAVNAKGMFLVCQAALRHMIGQKGGCFVNLASVSGKVGGVLAGADYSASKAAVICLTKSLAKTGAPHGIRANSVAPGSVYSPMLDQYYVEHAEEMKGFESGHPFGRFGRPGEVAAAVAFLASPEASYINGACLDVNGGTLMD
jgi:NAD(P)-dependent dehydrogenase (short-subunit alcohol dehydrogenase family)